MQVSFLDLCLLFQLLLIHILILVNSIDEKCHITASSPDVLFYLLPQLHVLEELIPHRVFLDTQWMIKGDI